MVVDSETDLGELFQVLKTRLGIRASCRKTKDFDDHTYILWVNTENDTPVLPWYGESPADCANQMMNTFSRSGFPQKDDRKVFVSKISSIKELRMKLDLMGR